MSQPYIACLGKLKCTMLCWCCYQNRSKKTTETDWQFQPNLKDSWRSQEYYVGVSLGKIGNEVEREIQIC